MNRIEVCVCIGWKENAPFRPLNFAQLPFFDLRLEEGVGRGAADLRIGGGRGVTVIGGTRGNQAPSRFRTRRAAR